MQYIILILDRISNVTISKTMPPQNEHNNTLNNDKWYYICVTTVEGIVYYIASQDSLMINSIKSSKYSYTFEIF